MKPRRDAAGALGLVLVLLLALTRGVLLAGLVPPFQGTDEPAYVDYVQRLAESHRFPVPKMRCAPFSEEARAAEAAFGTDLKFRPDRPVPPLLAYAPPSADDPAARATTGCGASAAYPPLYFATAALGYAAVRDAPFLTRVFAARLASVGWMLLTALFAYLLGLWWFGTTRDALLVGILVPSQPMIAFLSSVVSNEAALFTCGTAAFAGIAALHRDGALRRIGLALLGVAAAAGVLAKPTATVYLPVFAGCAGLALGARRPRSWAMISFALAPAAVAQAIWSFVSRPATRDLLAHTALDIDIPTYLSRYVGAERIWRRFGGGQFWLSWGWLDTELTDGYYVALAGCLVLAALGFAIRWRWLERRDRAVAVCTTVAIAYAIVALHVLEYEWLRASGLEFLQGRYLLMLFPLIAVALVTGLRAFRDVFGARIDGAWSLATLLLVVDAAGLARALTRWYGA
jgi:hypothetical protein